MYALFHPFHQHNRTNETTLLRMQSIESRTNLLRGIHAIETDHRTAKEAPSKRKVGFDSTTKTNVSRGNAHRLTREPLPSELDF